MHPERAGRRLSVLALLVALVLAMGAVGIAAARSDPPGPLYLRFTWWGDPRRAELTNEQVDLFMAAHPDIHVQTEPTVFDGYLAKLSAEIAAGTAPDVITLGGSYPVAYGAAGALLDLTTVADVVHLDAYAPNAYSGATVGHSVYGLPTGGTTIGLCVNNDVLGAAGLTLPDDASWTWEDFIAWAGAAATKLPDGVYATDWHVGEAKGPFASQRGHPLYTPEGEIGLDEATVQALFEIALALMANGGMPPAQITAGLRHTQLEQTLFGQGRAATMIGYSDDLQAFHELLGADVSLVKIPGETPERPGLAVLPSQSFGISSGSQHPHEAAMLVDWLLNEPAAARIILGERGLSFNPAILDVISPLLAEYDQRSARYLARIAVEGGPYVAPARGSSKVDGLWLRTEDEVLFGAVSPADAAATLVAEAKDIIAAARDS